MKRRCAVVGAGIIGQIVALELSQSNVEIEVFDEVFDEKQPRFHRNIIGNDATWIEGSRIMGFPGGQVIWGTNSSFTYLPHDWDWPSEFINSLGKYGIRLRKYGFPRLIPKPIKLNLTNTQFPYFDVKEWRHKQQLKILFNKKLKKRKFIFQNKSIKIVTLNSKKQYSLETSDNQIFDSFDFVVLCAGTLGNQEVVARSGWISNLPNGVFDHPCITLCSMTFEKPFLVSKEFFGSNRRNRKNVKRCYYFEDKSQNLLWTVRIFPTDVLQIKHLIESLTIDLRSKDLRCAFKKIVISIRSLASGRIVASGLRIDATLDFLKNNAIKVESWSKSNQIDWIQISSEEIDLPKSLISLILQKLESIKNIEFNPATISWNRIISSKNLKSSSHLMGSVPFEFKESNGEINERFELRGKSNVFLAGASSFPTTVPGHPTMMAAATSMYICDLIKNELAKLN